jgi:predicted membrane chloride channel (bestrophin family)
LARNEDVEYKTDDDPMLHVQALRTHVYTVNMKALASPLGEASTNQLELLERMKMVDLLNEFVVNYRTLLILKSTPVPFAMIQMGRTFLFLFTFSIPLVLRGVVDEIYSAMAFVFFLTYGFVGLEIVAMKLMNPFGDGVNDLNISGMKEATAIGIQKDLQAFGESINLLDKRLQYSRQKPRAPMRCKVYDDGNPDPNMYHSLNSDVFPSHS